MLSASQQHIVASHPIGENLSEWLRIFATGSSALTQMMGRGILMHLAGRKAACLLDGIQESNLAADICAFTRRILRNEISAENLVTLTECIESGETDIRIWEAVYELLRRYYAGALVPFENPLDSVASTSATHTIAQETTRYESATDRKRRRPQTPPPADSDDVSSSTLQTSLSESNRRLRSHLDNHLFRHASSYVKTMFDFGCVESLRAKRNEMLSQLLSRHDGKRWTGFPKKVNHFSAHMWISDLIDSVKPNCPQNKVKFEAVWERGKHTAYPYCVQTWIDFVSDDETQQSQADVFQSGAVAASDSSVNDLRVVGMISYDMPLAVRDNTLELARYLRELFAAKPLHLFQHGFILQGSTIEFFVFNRACSLSTGRFDIQNRFEDFARGIVFYLTMNEIEAGANPFVSNAMGMRKISLNDAQGRSVDYTLGRPLYRKAAKIFSRGTTCFPVDTDCMAKFAWQPDQHEAEVDLLRHARNVGVEGVVELVAERTLTKISDLPGHEDELKHPPADDEVWCESKTLRCFVMRPAGRNLCTFVDVRELLGALRDGVRGSQSLYTKAYILHQDISPNNIIITDPEKTNGWRGLLIDLDAARRLNSPFERWPKGMGNRPFMAIEAHFQFDDEPQFPLRLFPQHEIESFLYTLITLCIERGGLDSDILDSWSSGSHRQMAEAKYHRMTRRSDFEELMTHFPVSSDMAVVQELCRTLRRMIFGDWLTNPHVSYNYNRADPEQPYQEVLAAFDQAISRLR